MYYAIKILRDKLSNKVIVLNKIKSVYKDGKLNEEDYTEACKMVTREIDSLKCAINRLHEE